jgi:copper chaperone CopZ
MEEIQIQVPAMYGDHHVLEVRRILLEIPGVMDVNASSCFQVAQVKYDPAQTESETIHAVLEAAGYLQSLQIPTESGIPSYGTQRSDVYFRQTASLEHVSSAVQFTQKVSSSGRPLWPCPGMGLIRRDEE